MFNSTVNELAKYTMQDHKGDLSTICAEDLISTKTSFHEDQPITEAANVLVKAKVSGYAVTNSNGELVGFLSEKDCLKHLFDDSLNKMISGTVKDDMTKNPLTFKKEDSVYHVIEHFISKPFQAYPVVENGKFIGLIRRQDVLKVLLKKGVNL